MDLFFSSTANHININAVQQADPMPAPQAQNKPLEQGSKVDFSGASTPQKDRRSGSLDSLGNGNVL